MFLTKEIKELKIVNDIIQQKLCKTRKQIIYISLLTK